MIIKRSSIYILLLIFLISFFIKLIPLYQNYEVPLGSVDTSYHISSALDVSEGNFKSLIHPWWHLKNHYLLNGYDIVDRNSTSFFYPPLIHIVLAFSFLFIHPGIASIIVISFLYSLSVFAIFFLCKSFSFEDRNALTSTAVISVSIPLIYSQIYGFWTFAIASNFLILSYSFLRFKSRKFTLISIIFSFLAVITHWTFLFLVMLIGLIELIMYKNKEAKLYIFLSVLVISPFYLYLFYLANPLSHVATHLEIFFFPSYIIILLAIIAFILNYKKYVPITLFIFLTLISSFIYYGLKIKIIFGDMVQFAYPFFIAFFIGSLFQRINKKNLKFILIILILGVFIFNCISIQKIFYSTGPSITNKEFNDLLKLRKEFKPDDRSILAIDRGLLPWWIILVSKDSKIVYPDTYEAEDMIKYYKNYISKEINTMEDYKFYKIAKRGDSLVLEKNVKLSEEYLFP